MEVTAAAAGDLESQDPNPTSSEPDPSLNSGPVQASDSETPQSSCAPHLIDPGPPEAKELQEGQEIYIQTEGLTVELAEPGSDRVVIVNGPDGTTMHIQTPEGVPLEAVQALLGIEASEGAKAPQ